MLASPPPSTDVTLDHRFQLPALNQQRPCLPVLGGDRRLSSTPYHHLTAERQARPEINWNSGSIGPDHLTLEDTPRFSDNAMERKPHTGSPSAPSLCTPQTAANSVSPPSSHLIAERGEIPQLPSLSRRRSQAFDRAESRPYHSKRPRPPSLSALDLRSLEKPRLTIAPPEPSPPRDDHGHGKSADDLQGEDSKRLPPIVPRLERDLNQDTLCNELKSSGFPSSLNLSQASDIAKENNEVLGEGPSSSHRTALTHPNQASHLDRTNAHSSRVSDSHLGLQLSGNPPEAVFTLSPYSSSHHQQVSAPPHSAPPGSFARHHQPQYSSQSAGYLSSIHSPVAPHAVAHDAPAHRASYPGSPNLGMTAPNSAAFHSGPNTPFGPVSPHLDPVGGQNHLPPVSPHFKTSPPPFPQAATSQLLSSSYPNDSNKANSDRPTPPSTQLDPVTSNPALSPGVTAPSPSQWSPVEGQPPRRRGKLPPQVTCILRTWLMAHTGHPYPTEEEKKLLCDQTKLTMNQVSNWFINARRRILVPPTGANAVHEVRPPGRRQAQSQLARIAASPRGAPPGLTIHHHHHPSNGSVLGSPMFSPMSAGSPAVMGSTFDFRYPLHSQSHDACLQTSRATGPYRAPVSLPPGGHWAPSGHAPPHGVAHSPGYSSATNSPAGSVPYYSASSSPYPHYSGAHHSVSNTPLPSPHYHPPYSLGGPTHYQASHPRLPSPRPHPSSHPPTPTALHPATNTQPPGAYISQAPTNQSP